ncbi:hypothetical protein BH09PLA1_BH09PLA1_22940 [soil metagenome]
MRGINLLAAAGALLFGVATASAATVNVTVRGPVDFNVIQGSMAGIQPGAPVVMSFNVDSNVFFNSPSFPTRGYAIDLSSFAMTVGGVNVPIVIPAPSGQPQYFVLRNNDPAVDGFFISDGNVDFPFPLAVNITGLTPVHELDFSVGYSNGTQISSLNILDAVGTYDLSAIGSYNWGIGRFGNHGAEYAYETITIAVVPEPASIGACALVAVVGLASRRRRGI